MFKRIVLSLALAASVVMGLCVAAAAPDLAVTSNVLNRPGYGGSGDTMNVSISFINSGSSVATGGSISYTLSSELSFGTLPSGWTVVGQTATFTGDFATGVVTNTGFSVVINDFYSLRTVTGTVAATVAGDTDFSNNTFDAAEQL